MFLAVGLGEGRRGGEVRRGGRGRKGEEGGEGRQALTHWESNPSRQLWVLNPIPQIIPFGQWSIQQTPLA